MAVLLEIMFAASVASAPYVVQPGDTLSEIGSNTGHSWYAIYDMNRLAIGDNPNAIRPGMVLQLPWNNDRSLGFSSNENEVVVMAGDSLSGIGSRVGVSWQAIAEVNGIDAPYIIHPGQILRLS